MACKSLDELQAFVKSEGFDLDEAEAQAIFEEMYEIELSDEELEAVAGGMEWCHCDSDYECTDFHHRRRRRKK